MTHEKFHYDDVSSLRTRAQELGAFLPLSGDLDVLKIPLHIGGYELSNRLAIQPMEGTDGTPHGAPGELTRRRYRRFAHGGAALIWFEAVATLPRVRASAHQLMLTRHNLSDFQRLTEEIKETGLKENGYAPLVIMQATHSGRYAKPNGVPEPLIACHNPVLEDVPLPDACVVTDGQLRAFEAAFEETARLCRLAGFDGMDVKCCHRYLASELLSAYERKGMYGGSFENRIRFLRNAYIAARAGAGDDFLLTSRMNVYDGFPYPWGFGVSEGGGLEPDLTEAKRLIEILMDEMRIPVINITMGNPYKNPHVNRPYDRGNYVPDEHPLTGVGRMMRCVSDIQHAFPSLPVIGSGFTYLRQFSPLLAAGMVASGGCAMAGFGRMAIADPDFPREMLSSGTLASPCLTCGGCAQLLRAGKPAGCVVRDEYSLEGLK